MSASPPPAPKRRKPALPRLVLHFDVNETIMVSDPAGAAAERHRNPSVLASACKTPARRRCKMIENGLRLSAGGDDFDAVLNKMVAKTAFARRKDGGDDVRTAALEDLEWRDGAALGASADAEPDAALWTAWAPPGDGSRAAVAIPSLKKSQRSADIRAAATPHRRLVSIGRARGDAAAACVYRASSRGDAAATT